MQRRQTGGSRSPAAGSCPWILCDRLADFLLNRPGGYQVSLLVRPSSGHKSLPIWRNWIRRRFTLSPCYSLLCSARPPWGGLETRPYGAGTQGEKSKGKKDPTRKSDVWGTRLRGAGRGGW